MFEALEVGQRSSLHTAGNPVGTLVWVGGVRNRLPKDIISFYTNKRNILFHTNTNTNKHHVFKLITYVSSEYQ
jgi:hypothetical protein